MTRYSYIFAHDLYSCVVFSRRLISDIGPQQGIEGRYRWIVWQGVKFQLGDIVDQYRPWCGGRPPHQVQPRLHHSLFVFGGHFSGVLRPTTLPRKAHIIQTQ